jgi:type IV pilus assembly protein PilA
VKTVSTSTAGVVTVTAQNIDKDNIDDKTVTLTPYSDAAGTKVMDPTSDSGKAVALWKCAPGTVNAKFLPGSCRG